jgi:hypothetical protein
VSWQVDTIRKRTASLSVAPNHMEELFNRDFDDSLREDQEGGRNAELIRAHSMLSAEELCHQCIESLRYRGMHMNCFSGCQLLMRMRPLQTSPDRISSRSSRESRK